MFPLLKWMKCTILNNKIGGESKEFSSNHVTRFFELTTKVICDDLSAGNLIRSFFIFFVESTSLEMKGLLSSRLNHFSTPT